MKTSHEIRDSVHGFVHIDSDERRILDSRPIQRLRHIRQLGLSSFVYPGSTHMRFEHSLGVMELAGRVFDVITNPQVVTDEVSRLLPELRSREELHYWKCALRMAALCHDVGHLPFSHSAEQELLPRYWSHSRLTAEIIKSDYMRELWRDLPVPLRSEHVAKIAVGPEGSPDSSFTAWESLLAEIIVGDCFGVDRMDYLLRDSLYAGVPYGVFDHYRLIDTLRILPAWPLRDDSSQPEPTLGIEEGGLLSAEALSLARYLMFRQVYYHPIRRIYDVHLRDFLALVLPDGQFSTNVATHLSVTDNEIMSSIIGAAYDTSEPGHIHARRILCREHFRILYQRNQQDAVNAPTASEAIYRAALLEFGPDNIRRDRYAQPEGVPEFPVMTRDGRATSSLSLSQTLQHLPTIAVDCIFVAPDIREQAREWLDLTWQHTLGSTRKEERWIR